MLPVNEAVNTGHFLRETCRHMLEVLVQENFLPEDALELALEQVVKRCQLYRVRLLYSYTTSRFDHASYSPSDLMSYPLALRWAAELALDYFEQERAALPPGISVSESVEFADLAGVDADFLSGRYKEVIRKFNAAGLGVNIDIELMEPHQELFRFAPHLNLLLLSDDSVVPPTVP